MFLIGSTIYLENKSLQVSHYTIKSKKIPASFDGFKILQLSDLHSKCFGKNNRKLITRIHRENPDIVVITGDMINAKNTENIVFIKLAEELSKSYATYYIYGNHELIISDEELQQIKAQLNSTGVKILNNEKTEIKKGNSKINLYGLWIDLKYYKYGDFNDTKDINYDPVQLENTLGKIDNTAYNILLTHNPFYFQTYSDWGADLTLAGHVHGGVIRIPFLGGVFSPEKKLFPKYDSGTFFLKGKELIVNRGLGDSYSGFRILNRPEISVITLIK